MRAVIQRVRNASVETGGQIGGSIERGLLVYLGVAAEDSEKEALWMAEKTASLRIFDDPQGKMNLSLIDIYQEEGAKTGVLAVSQFTLLGDATKGRRPYYGAAAGPDLARALYEYYIARIRALGLICETGVFQAQMKVSYTNEGPVTIILDSALRES
ncbi:MAG: D-aminoacyl-tRNA deacylase [Treponema sp.]|nr:D-aminoacyl-tRNA deacylase [Treponema sp.]